VPTYQYACTTCGEQVEAVQRFDDDPLTVCPACGGSLRKIYTPVGIVFKGSGFYRTDSRQAPAKSEDAGAKAAKAASDGSSGPGEGSSDGKKDSATAEGKKPGAAKASQPAAAKSG
jgi:putative FmdB family regulatory protein